MKKHFPTGNDTPRRLWPWRKETAPMKSKTKPSAPFFKRKLPPAHRS